MNEMTAFDYNGPAALLLTVREKVNIFENEMRKQRQIDLEVKHHFSYGIYARELFIPKGVMLTGKIVRIKAPFTIISKAGTKRIAIAHDNCIWITIHGTHETNLDKIEEYFIAQNEKEYLEFCGQMKLIG